MQYTRLNATERSVLMSALARMPLWLRDACAGLPAELAVTPGPAGAFSPVEQVWHLADLEREGFGLRIRRLQREHSPQLLDFDGTRIAQERNYRALSLADGLRAFAAARAENLAALAAVRAADWSRAGTQEGVGPVSLCDMPVFLQQHDASHVTEIQEWYRHVGIDPVVMENHP
jgi:hypothetical protein